MDVLSLTPLHALLIPLAAAALLVPLGRWPNLRESLTLLAGGLTLWTVASMIPAVIRGDLPVLQTPPVVASVPIAFRVDGLGLTFALVASSLWIPTSIYSIGYMRGTKESNQTRFYSFFALSIAATLGVAFSANLLTLYLFYELLSLSTYPLVTHQQTREARNGGRTYLSHLLIASIGLALPALIYVYGKSGGDLEFSLNGVLAGHVGKTETLVLLIAFLFGFAKAGLMPLHSWLPGAMVAPTPVSALLHAVAVVKVGVFCVVRIVTGIFGTDLLQEFDLGIVAAWIAAFTVLTSSLIALSQDNLKRRLAFSTVGQLSYIVLGVALLSSAGLIGGVLHIVMHAFGKITLFFCAGAIYVASGKKYISQLDGIGRRMPWTMSAFAIGALSVAGLPPSGGFISKLQLLIGTLQSDQPFLLAVFLLSTLLNVAYFFPIVIRAFFNAPPASEPSDGPSLSEAPLTCVIPLVITALTSLALFFGAGWPLALIETVFSSK